MTQKTKLEIIGEYREDHPGPFCTRDGRPVRLLTKTDGNERHPIVGFIEGDVPPTTWDREGLFLSYDHKGKHDLMCAREVPVAREFWVNEYADGTIAVFFSKTGAEGYVTDQANIRTIHVREVLPGEGA